MLSWAQTGPPTGRAPSGTKEIVGALIVVEMWRVLDCGGFALIEGRPYEEPSPAEIASGARRGPEHRIEWGPVEGTLNPHYRHDERSFLRICQSAEVEPVQIFEREWAGRQRLLFRLDKPVSSA